MISVGRNYMFKPLLQSGISPVTAAVNGGGDMNTDVSSFNDMFQENTMLQEQIKRHKERISELQGKWNARSVGRKFRIFAAGLIFGQSKSISHTGVICPLSTAYIPQGMNSKLLL